MNVQAIVALDGVLWFQTVYVAILTRLLHTQIQVHVHGGCLLLGFVDAVQLSPGPERYVTCTGCGTVTGGVHVINIRAHVAQERCLELIKEGELHGCQPALQKKQQNLHACREGQPYAGCKVIALRVLTQSVHMVECLLMVALGDAARALTGLGF